MSACPIRSGGFRLDRKVGQIVEVAGFEIDAQVFADPTVHVKDTGSPPRWRAFGRVGGRPPPLGPRERLR